MLLPATSRACKRSQCTWLAPYLEIQPHSVNIQGPLLHCNQNILMPYEASISLKRELATVTTPASTNVAVFFMPEHFLLFGNHVLPAQVHDDFSQFLQVPVDYPTSQVTSFDKLSHLFIKYRMAVSWSAFLQPLCSLVNQMLRAKRLAATNANWKSSDDGFKHGIFLRNMRRA